MPDVVGGESQLDAIFGDCSSRRSKLEDGGTVDYDVNRFDVVPRHQLGSGGTYSLLGGKVECQCVVCDTGMFRLKSIDTLFDLVGAAAGEYQVCRGLGRLAQVNKSSDSPITDGMRAYKSLKSCESQATFVRPSHKDGLSLNLPRESLCYVNGISLAVELGVSRERLVEKV